MGAKQSTTTPTAHVETSQLQIINISGVPITAKTDMMNSVYIDNQKTGTLVINPKFKSVTIYAGSKEIEKISLSDLLSGGLNPVVYVKPSVQILSSDSLLPGKKSDSPLAKDIAKSVSTDSVQVPTPTGYVSRPTINVTPIPTTLAPVSTKKK
jgi:hypothetical protein